MLKNIKRFSAEVVETLPLMFREFSKREDNALTRGKISFPQMVALHFAAHKKCVKMTELAGVLSIRMSSATVLVDRLIRQRLLNRGRDLKDRRVVLVCVTKKGRKVVGQIMSQKRRSIEGIFSALTAAERVQYLRILRKVKTIILSK